MTNIIHKISFIEVNPAFTPHFYSPLRIEMRCRSEDALQKGLQATVADPLWMLSRQWQMGEFQGEDNGSPVLVEVKYKTNHLADLKTGEDRNRNNPVLPPLETIVEREPIPLDWRERVRIGQKFEELICKHLKDGENNDPASQVISVFRTKDFYGIDLPDTYLHGQGNGLFLDNDTYRFLHLMAGRSIDGGKVLSEIRDNNIPELPGEITVDTNKLNQAYAELEEWYKALYNLPGKQEKKAWQSNRLEYEFSLSTGDIEPVNIIAKDYRNGDLDWYSCDIENVQGNGTGGDEKRCTFTPTRVGFAGKPNERWWAFEDNQVNMGELHPHKDEHSKLLLTSFALEYADDWYYFPLEIPVPVTTLAKITSLTVTNVFGESFDIDPAFERGVTDSKSWEMFTMASPDRSDDDKNFFLFLPATPGFREESAPLEVVRLVRDEMANLVFAVEHIVPNGTGKPVDGFERQIGKLQLQRKKKIESLRIELTDIEKKIKELTDKKDAPDTSEEDKEAIQKKIDDKKSEIRDIEWEIAALKGEKREGSSPGESGAEQYKIASPVPENWIPFVPVKAVDSGLPDAGEGSVRLRQALMVRNNDADDAEPVEPMTVIIGGSPQHDELGWLNEESVTRAGVRVQITGQRVRWIDGRTYVWRGRKVLTGRGEGSSGLKFDYLKE